MPAVRRKAESGGYGKNAKKSVKIKINDYGKREAANLPPGCRYDKGYE
jgi:hypothetical protein